MKTIRTTAVAIAVLIAGSTAQATEVKGMVTTAMKAVLDKLRVEFEHKHSPVVRLAYGPSGGLAQRLRAGERTDFILIAETEIDKLMQEDRVLPGSTAINRTGIGIAVRVGAPKPDVSTIDALRRTLLAAKSVAHTAPAGGGITAKHLLAVFAKLGIASEVAAKTKLAAGGPNGRVSTLVANGEAEIGLQQVSELMSNPGVEVIGLLPGDLQQITVHRAAITVNAQEPEAAREFVRFLTQPDALTLYKESGLGL